MKNKKWVYVLFPAAILIWGYIAYQIYSTFKDPVNSSFSAASTKAKPLLSSVTDTFSLIDDYRDPFQGSSIQSKVISRSGSKLTEKATQEKMIASKAEHTSSVRFLGIISNKKKQVAIVQVGSSINNMKVGDKFQGLELLKILKDSIAVRYEGKKFYINRN